MASAFFSRLTCILGALAVLCLFGVQPGLAQPQNGLHRSSQRPRQTSVAGTVVWVAMNEGYAYISQSQQDGEQLMVSTIVNPRVEFDPCAVPIVATAR